MGSNTPNFRRKVRQRMRELGMTHGDLARAAGLDYMHVYRWLVMETSIKTERLEKIAGAVGLDLEVRR